MYNTCKNKQKCLHSHVGVVPDQSPSLVQIWIESPRKICPTSQWYSIVECTLKS